jgi:flagellar biosynthesis/type III secretory pathway M-ring protein FliF/YscJ
MEWSGEGGAWSRAAVGVASAVEGPGDFDAAGLLRTYGPQAGLGVLALFSVMMMTRMARRSTQLLSGAASTRPEADAEPTREPILAVGPRAVGQAEMSESVLTAKEVDDSTIRYDELTEEVSKMVQADPETAAGLMRRWIEQD